MIAPGAGKAARADTRPHGSVSYSGWEGDLMEGHRAGARRRAGPTLLEEWIFWIDDLRFAPPPVAPSGNPRRRGPRPSCSI